MHIMCSSTTGWRHIQHFSENTKFLGNENRTTANSGVGGPYVIRHGNLISLGGLLRLPAVQAVVAAESLHSLAVRWQVG